MTDLILTGLWLLLVFFFFFCSAPKCLPLSLMCFFLFYFEGQRFWPSRLSGRQTLRHVLCSWKEQTSLKSANTWGMCLSSQKWFLLFDIASFMCVISLWSMSGDAAGLQLLPLQCCLRVIHIPVLPCHSKGILLKFLYLVALKYSWTFRPGCWTEIPSLMLESGHLARHARVIVMFTLDSCN